MLFMIRLLLFSLSMGTGVFFPSCAASGWNWNKLNPLYVEPTLGVAEKNPAPVYLPDGRDISGYPIPKEGKVIYATPIRVSAQK